MLLQQNVGETFHWYFAFVCKMSMEISSDIFFFYLKISMIFAFAIKTSVKLFTDILHLFAKCRWKFPSTFYLFKISMISCFCLQNGGGKFQPYFISICKMSMEISIDILPLLSVNHIRIYKVFSQIFTKKEQILIKPFTSG